MKKTIKSIIVFLLLSIVFEVFGFNCDYFVSKSDQVKTETYSIVSNCSKVNDDTYKVSKKKGKLVIELKNLNKEIDYIYLDAVVKSSKDKSIVPASIDIYAIDDGHAQYYKLGNVSSYPSVNKTKYVKLHTYGKVQSLKIRINVRDTSIIKVKGIKTNCNVPFSFSINRVLFFTMLLCIVYAIRPQSSLYNNSLRRNDKKTHLLLFGIIVANIIAISVLIHLNTKMMNPVWQHHYQYYNLAQSLAKGKVNIDVGNSQIVKTLESMVNPYDTATRKSLINDLDVGIWDTAYFKGKFYVYFGIVPVLLFYLPYYLLFKAAMPTYIAVYICCVFTIIFAFRLIDKIVKRWFKDTNIGVQILLSLILANGIGTIQIVLSPDFYNLPVIMSIMFTLLGLNLLISALNNWEKEKNKTSIKTLNCLFFGALSMALVAGCRPNFLIGSFLVIPLFCKEFFKDKKFINKNNFLKLVVFAIPYIIVASGLMYYNYIRFGSPFDFGANYNLTTNDMTLRGFDTGRISQSVFMYLFQFPSISIKFPYVIPVNNASNYVGEQIKERMFGGVFFTHFYLLFILAIGRVSDKLKEKGLFTFTILSIAFAVIVAILDAQIAGILLRYCCDFLWLLAIPSVFIILSLFEKYNSKKWTRRILRALVIVLCLSFCFDIFMSISNGINVDSNDFYIIKGWFM